MKMAGKKNETKKTVADQGFTILEVMIAILILSIGLLGLTKMQLTAINHNSIAMKFTNATALAQGQIELLMSMPFADVADDTTTTSDGYTIAWTVAGSVDLDGDGDDEIKNVIVAVNDPKGKKRVEISFAKAADI